MRRLTDTSKAFGRSATALLAACLIATGAAACGDDGDAAPEPVSTEPSPTAPDATPQFKGKPETVTYLNRVNLLNSTFTNALVAIQPAPETAKTAEALSQAAGAVFLSIQSIDKSEVPPAAKSAHKQLVSELEQLQQTLDDAAEEVKSSGGDGPDDDFYSALEDKVQEQVNAATQTIEAINQAAG